MGKGPGRRGGAGRGGRGPQRPRAQFFRRLPAPPAVQKRAFRQNRRAAGRGKGEISGGARSFKKKRRHTSCLSDWSSDVCFSDLGPGSPTWTSSHFKAGGKF